MRIRSIIITLFFTVYFSPVNANENSFNSRDSLKAIKLLEGVEVCIKSGNVKCKQNVLSALSLANKINSSYLKALCYYSLASCEKKYRNDLTVEYAELAVNNSRACSNDSLLIQCLFQYSRSCCLLGKASLALTAQKEFNGLVSKKSDNFFKLKAGFETGYYYYSLHDYDAAREHYIKALGIANALNDSKWIAILKREIFNTEIQGFRTDVQAAYIFESYNYFKHHDELNTAYCLFATGNSYKINGNISRANQYYEEAINIFVKNNYLIEAGDASLTMVEGCLTDKRLLQKGLTATANAEKFYHAFSYAPGKIKVLIYFGRLYNAINRSDKANSYFAKADSLINVKPNNELRLMYLAGIIEKYRDNKQIDLAKDTPIQAGLLQLQVMPAYMIMRFAARAKTNGILSAAELLDIKKFTKTGMLDTALWNKKKDLNGFNPSTADEHSLDSSYNAIFNRQLSEVETRYKVKAVQDSLEKTAYAVKLNQLKINRQNWLIFFISGIAVLSALFLYRINKERKKALAAKQAITVAKKDADHRVKNSFASIKSIINDVNYKVSDKSGIEMLKQRIAPIDFLYQLLGKTSTGEIDMQAYFETITTSLSQQYNSTHAVQVQVNAPVTIDGEKASKLGLIVNELVTNSFKHALKNTTTGVVSIRCRKEATGKYHLTVADNGCGFPDNKLPQSQSGLWDVQALAQQIKADFKAESSNSGAQFEFWFI